MAGLVIVNFTLNIMAFWVKVDVELQRADYCDEYCFGFLHFGCRLCLSDLSPKQSFATLQPRQPNVRIILIVVVPL